MKFSEQFKRKVYEVFYSSLDVQNAFSILELPMGDYDNVKKAFKKMAMKFHPDKGGSEEQMKKINWAMDVLSVAPKQSTKTKDAFQQKEEEQREFKYKIIKEYLEKTLGEMVDKAIPVYTNYFESKFNKKFNVSDVKKDSTYWRHSFSRSLKFKSEDNSTIFDLDIFCEVEHSMLNALSVEDLDFKVIISTFAYDGGKKQKMSLRDYNWNGKSKSIGKPEDVFPPKKLDKMLDTNKTAKGFKRADAMAFFYRELGAKETSNGSAMVDLGNGNYLGFSRSVYTGRNRKSMAYWLVLGIYTTKGYGFTQVGDKTLFYGSIIENKPDFVETVKKCIELAKSGNPDSIKDYLKNEYEPKHKGEDA